jgi:hypothetical protein
MGKSKLHFEQAERIVLTSLSKARRLAVIRWLVAGQMM